MGQVLGANFVYYEIIGERGEGEEKGKLSWNRGGGR